MININMVCLLRSIEDYKHNMKLTNSNLQVEHDEDNIDEMGMSSGGRNC
jgi:hypothetical protein